MEKSGPCNDWLNPPTKGRRFLSPNPIAPERVGYRLVVAIVHHSSVYRSADGPRGLQISHHLISIAAWLMIYLVLNGFQKRITASGYGER